MKGLQELFKNEDDYLIALEIIHIHGIPTSALESVINSLKDRENSSWTKMVGIIITNATCPHDSKITFGIASELVNVLDKNINNAENI